MTHLTPTSETLSAVARIGSRLDRITQPAAIEANARQRMQDALDEFRRTPDYIQDEHDKAANLRNRAAACLAEAEEADADAQRMSDFSPHIDSFLDFVAYCTARAERLPTNAGALTAVGIATDGLATARQLHADFTVEADLAIDRRLLSAASTIEAAWGGPGAAATDLAPLASAVEHGGQPTESQYAAVVQLLLEDAGFGEQSNIASNRATLAAYRSIAAEPGDVVEFIVGKLLEGRGEVRSSFTPASQNAGPRGSR
jgi:hypothetical protein